MKKVKPLPARKVDTSRRFSDEQVWDLRRRVRAGEKIARLSREFGVSRRCVSDAVYGLVAYRDV